MTSWPPCRFSSKQLHSLVNYISEKQKYGRLVTKLQTKNLFRGRERDSDYYMGHESLFLFRYNNARQWLNIDLGTISRVKRISTQGRYDADQWVTSYTVSYSVDNIKFYPYKEKRRIKVRSISLLLKKFEPFLYLSKGNSSVFELTEGVVRGELVTSELASRDTNKFKETRFRSTRHMSTERGLFTFL